MSEAPLFVAVIDNLVNYLRMSLQDKRTDRAGAQWIYPEYPRIDAMKPRLAVTPSGLAGRAEMGLSDGGQRLTIQIDIDIYTDTQFEWTEPGTGRVYSGSSLREYIASEVDALLNSSRKALHDDYGWHDFKMFGIVPFPYDEEHDECRRTLRYIVELEDPKVESP